MSAPLPSVFVSHGAPTLIIEDSPGRHFLAGLGRRLGRPTAVLAVSAHWTTAQPMVSGASAPETVHDFHGFPRELYALRYPAPGAPELAQRVDGLLRAAGIGSGIDPARGLDHSAWVPLMLMYPQADIPVTQLSVQPGRSTADHIALGRALAPLRDEGVLILASGGAVHNLRDFRFGATTAAPWAGTFADWLDGVLASGDVDAVAHWTERCPEARLAHPTDEHFLPLPVALGAAGPAPRAERLHAGFEHGSIGMQAYAFHGAQVG